MEPDLFLFGYTFSNISLLKQALVHTSFANEKNQEFSNERLEFLGDAVIELIVSEYLYTEFPHSPEGELARLRAAVVCEGSLARWARKMRLGEVLLLGVGEHRTGGRNRDSILSDALEAVIGAHYLSEGFERTRKFVIDNLREEVERAKAHGLVDPKSQLQETLQALGRECPEYRVVHETGPDHAKVFTVDVFCGDKVMGRGLGRSKKDAQQQAAKDALRKLETSDKMNYLA